jgi:hypothetical protein
MRQGAVAKKLAREQVNENFIFFQEKERASRLANEGKTIKQTRADRRRRESGVRLMCEGLKS